MELLIAFATNLFTQFIKKVVVKKYGTAGVQFVVFSVALIGTVIYKYAFSVPHIRDIILEALKTMAYSVAMYEIILKNIGFDTKKMVEDTTSDSLQN